MAYRREALLAALPAHQLCRGLQVRSHRRCRSEVGLCAPLPGTVFHAQLDSLPPVCLRINGGIALDRYLLVRRHLHGWSSSPRSTSVLNTAIGECQHHSCARARCKRPGLCLGIAWAWFGHAGGLPARESHAFDFRSDSAAFARDCAGNEGSTSAGDYERVHGRPGASPGAIFACARAASSAVRRVRMTAPSSAASGCRAARPVCLAHM